VGKLTAEGEKKGGSPKKGTTKKGKKGRPSKKKWTAGKPQQGRYKRSSESKRKVGTRVRGLQKVPFPRPTERKKG